MEPAASTPTRAGPATSRFAKYLRDARTFPRDARTALRVGGWSSVWTELAERTFRRAFRTGRYLVVVQDIGAHSNFALPDGIVLRALGADELDILHDIATQRTLATFARRLAAGRTAVVALRDGRPVGWGWVSQRMDAAVEGHRLPLPADAVYLWDGFVVRSERGRGVGAAVVHARHEIARGNGARTTWQMIRRENISSFRALERVSGDLRIIGELRATRILNRTRAELILAPGQSLLAMAERP